MAFQIYRRLPLLLVLFLVLSIITPAPSASATPWQSKVDPGLLLALEQQGLSQTGFLVTLREQADLSGAQSLSTKLEKGEYVFKALTEKAQRTQEPLLSELQRRDIPFRSYWITNMVWVRGDLQLLQELAGRVDVDRIYANPAVQASAVEVQAAAEKTTAIEWNIEKVGAPLVWAEGYTGEGVVVGGQDTGYDWQHPALLRQYRGWDGSQADHSYSWHDAIREDLPESLGENRCGFDSSLPCDDNGHGTHTMGTIVGDDGAGTQIGVAPGAKWIGCRNMENGWGTPASYAECYEWFVAPYPPGSSPLQGDPAKAPDIINNSWACPPAEGCTEPDILLAVVDNVRAAGILTVHSAGNAGGAGCSTVNEVAALYDSSFTVGNLTSSDTIAFSSSRGPVLVDGSGRLKPDITAPGTYIFSSYLDGGYRITSGTSMAAPHVAGVVALLLSAQPALSGQVDRIEELLARTAFPLISDQDCGDISGNSIPNNTYGYGRVDAWEALKSLPHGFAIRVSAHTGAVMPGEPIHYTVVVTHNHALFDTQEVLIAARLPAGTRLVTSNHEYIQTGQDLLWGFSSLAPQESVVLELELQVEESVTIGTALQALFSVTSQDVEIPISSQTSLVYVGRVFYLPVIPGLLG
jgi:serine protease AprX